MSQQRSAADLLAALDAACLGRTPEQSLRKVGNGGAPLWTASRPKRYISTHVTGDLCCMADVIEKFREGGR